MIGKLNINNSEGGTYEITFKVTPENATVVLRDRNNEIVNPTSDKIYNVAPRNIFL